MARRDQPRRVNSWPEIIGRLVVFSGRAGHSAQYQINDDCLAFKDLQIWAFAPIRGNYQPHSAITHIGQPIVDYDTESDAGGDCRVVGFISPAREVSIFGDLTSLAMSVPSPALAGGDHYREMAGRVRELARFTRSPGISRELVDLAKRYDRRGDHFDRRSAVNRLA